MKQNFKQNPWVSLPESHLKMMALGAGGKEGITPRHRGQVGAALRQEYNRLFD